MSTATLTPSVAAPVAPSAPAASNIREPTAVYIRRLDLAMRQARSIPTRQHPLRRVVAYSTPDPRHPIFKDYILQCSHRFSHIPMRRGADQRYHVAKAMRCPLCAVGAPPRGVLAQPAPTQMTTSPAPSPEQGG